MRLLVPLLLLLVGAALAAAYVPPWEQVSFQATYRNFDTKPWYTSDVGNRFCPGGVCEGKVKQRIELKIGCGSTGKYEGSKLNDMNLRFLGYSYFTVEPLDSKNNVLRVINDAGILQVRQNEQDENMLIRSDTYSLEKTSYNVYDSMTYGYWKSATNAKYSKPPTAKGINAGYVYFGKKNYFGDGYLNFQYIPERDAGQKLTQQRQFPVSYTTDITMLDKNHPFYFKKLTISLDNNDPVIEIPVGVEQRCESDYERWINSYGAYVFYYSGKPSEGSDFRQIYYYPDIASYPFLT